nr:hypothetical protein [Glycomyces paridis]
MRDRERQPRVRDRLQHRDPAGPEHRDVAGSERHRVAEVRSGEVADADAGGVADVDGRAVLVRQVRRHAFGPLDEVRGHRPHGDHDRAAEAPGAQAPHPGAVHRDAAALLAVAQRDARALQQRVEREAAPHQEGHQVLAPHLDDLGPALDRLALAPHQVRG